MLEAAHAAPSVGLTQPWDFVLVTDPAVRRTFYDHVQAERANFAGSLSGTEAERFAGIKIDGIMEATLSVVVTYDPARGAPSVLGRHTIADVGLYSVCLAIENLWLASTAEGMGMGWVSFYREGFLRELLGIPSTIRPGRVALSGPGLASRDRAGPRTARLAGPGTADGGTALRPVGRDERRETAWAVMATGSRRMGDRRRKATHQRTDRTAGPRRGPRRRERSPRRPERPYTLAIDIGGTGLKASVLDATGAMVADRVRVATTYPLPPTGDGGMVPTLAKLVASLPEADRVSAGFPGWSGSATS